MSEKGGPQAALFFAGMLVSRSRMLLPLLQLLVSIAAGVLLFRLTTAAMRGPAWTRYAVAAGFVGRAVAGQILFWISWLRLPFGSRLQLGRGLWFFAVDATLYLNAALTAAVRGPSAIATADPTLPSITFVKTLATAAWLFGAVPSVGVLLNLFCFAGSVVVIRHWAAADHLATRRASIAVAILSLSPSTILWSLQPLKDTYFQFLLIAFFASCAALLRWWRARGTARHGLPIAAALTATLYALAGIRWYVGLALLFATLVLLTLVFFESQGRRITAIAGSLALLFVLRTALVASTGPYLPPKIASVLAPMRDAPARPAPDIVTTVVQVREGFERAGGATVIQPGPRLASPPEQVPPAPTPADVREIPGGAPAAAASGDVDEIRRLLGTCRSSWEHGEIGACTDLYWHSPEFVISSGARSVRGWDTARTSIETGLHQHTRIASELQLRRVAADRILVSGTWIEDARATAAEPAGSFVLDFRKLPGLGWKAVAVRVSEAAASSPPASTAVTPQAAPSSGRSRHATRLLAGTAALILPQRIGAALGLFQVGGGQGLLWFTDVATLVFDGLLLIAFIGVVGRILRAPRDPLLWAVVIVTSILGAALAYSVPNWGTLFRLREMIFAALVLLYVASSPRQEVETVAGATA